MTEGESVQSCDYVIVSKGSQLASVSVKNIKNWY